jgi:hypothetical protein
MMIGALVVMAAIILVLVLVPVLVRKARELDPMMVQQHHLLVVGRHRLLLLLWHPFMEVPAFPDLHLLIFLLPLPLHHLVSTSF